MAAINERKSAERWGRRSESLAALALTCKFYRIVGRRIRTLAGEIDLVAVAPRGPVCFIEVKARGDLRDAAEAVTFRQRSRIERAAELYLRANPGLRHKAVRFDIMLIVPRQWPRHIRDAWRPGF